VPSMSGRLIDLARAECVASKAGVVTLPMESSEVRFLKILTDPTATWTGEITEISESSGTFGLMTLHARPLVAMTLVSEDLLADVSNVGEVVENQLAVAIGKKLDSGILNGIESGEGRTPTGLRTSEDLTDQAVDASYAPDQLLTALCTLETGNVPPPYAMIMHPTAASYIRKKKDGQGLYLGLPEDVDVPRHVSSQVIAADGTSNQTLYFGNFGNIILGVRQRLTIEISKSATSSSFAKRQVGVRAVMRCDYGIARAGDIIRLTGVAA